MAVEMTDVEEQGVERIYCRGAKSPVLRTRTDLAQGMDR
jgi:hypothetical protein